MSGHPRLYRRGANYYHRGAIPVDIQDLYPKTEETFSLRTKDHQEAVRRVRVAAADVDQKFEKHRHQLERKSQPVITELFEDSNEAMERVEDILDGADCTLVKMKPKDETTNWQTQKTISNGSPTYGRKYSGQGVSVEKAKPNQWFYMEHGSAPQGWFDSAEKAKQAFDNSHR